MANEKVLIFEAPWSSKIDRTQATREIYTSAETLLRVGPEPVGIIHRPLITSTYKQDIQKFTALECNQRGACFVVFSAHGAVSRPRHKGKVFIRRKLQAFDGEINLSAGIRDVSKSLSRTTVILDSCEVGKTIKSFYRASKAAGVIGFEGDADWIDSTMFILAILLKFHSADVMRLKRIRRTTKKSTCRQQRVLEGMTNGAWKSLAKSVGVTSYFGP